MAAWNLGEWWPAIANLAGLLVWGGMTHQRLRTLERDMAGLHDLGNRMTRVEVRLDLLCDQIRELNSSLRRLASEARFVGGGG